MTNRICVALDSQGREVYIAADAVSAIGPSDDAEYCTVYAGGHAHVIAKDIHEALRLFWPGGEEEKPCQE